MGVIAPDTLGVVHAGLTVGRTCLAADLVVCLHLVLVYGAAELTIISIGSVQDQHGVHEDALLAQRGVVSLNVVRLAERVSPKALSYDGFSPVNGDSLDARHLLIGAFGPALSIVQNGLVVALIAQTSFTDKTVGAAVET